jgi:hypothetical protein
MLRGIVTRDDRIEAIVQIGRRTRTAPPRWLWMLAAIVGVICATGFAVVILTDVEPAGHPVERRAAPASGLGTGLLIGAGGGVVIGFALGRHRRDHSSRKSP